MTAPTVRRPTLHVQHKALTLFTAGHAQVDAQDEAFVAATVQGSKPWPYAVSWYAEAWHCDCQARGFCKHILAVQMRLAADAAFKAGADVAEMLRMPDQRWAELATTVPATTDTGKGL